MATSEEEVKTLVGLTTEEAGRRITKQNSYYMIATEDGTSFPIHMMLDPDRVCIHVENGNVTVPNAAAGGAFSYVSASAGRRC